MQKKKENFRPLRSVTTFALAAAIITGSIYTVAAAVNHSAETEQAVNEAIQGLSGAKTMVIIAHRESAIAVCDKTIKLGFNV